MSRNSKLISENFDCEGKSSVTAVPLLSNFSTISFYFYSASSFFCCSAFS